MMMEKKTKFAVFFGNRDFFPVSMLSAARKEMLGALKKLGHKTLVMAAKETPHGAVKTPEDGKKFANFLQENKGKFGGVILCLPNFGDESGAVTALKDANVPILVQAYPDDLDKMHHNLRRDAFCGKFSVMDVFCQYGVPFTALEPHTVHPTSKDFAENIDYFDRLCRVVQGMKGLVVGAIGARTTAFKTVRIDELALQQNGITMETLDLATVLHRFNQLRLDDPAVKTKLKTLKNYTNWDGVPSEAIEKLSRLGVVFDRIKEEMGLDIMALRCWLEVQEQLGVSICVLISELNNRGIITACEVDVGNAVTMHAMSQASGNSATCLDWNNNYGDDRDKCILFHCGPVPQSMMTGKGHVTDHPMLAKALGAGCGWGPNTGRIAPTPMTYGSMLTQDGKLKFFLGEGEFTDDPIADDFFGCAGVAKINNLQDVLQTIGYAGHRHHVSTTPGHILTPISEAFTKYLGYDLTTF